MKTLNVSVALSSLALENLQQPKSPNEILSRAQKCLSKQMEVMGQFIRCKPSQQRRLDDDMQLQHFDLQYEKYTLRFKLMFFKPRGTWQVQGFQFLS